MEPSRRFKVKLQEAIIALLQEEYPHVAIDAVTTAAAQSISVALHVLAQYVRQALGMIVSADNTKGQTNRREHVMYQFPLTVGGAAQPDIRPRVDIEALRRSGKLEERRNLRDQRHTTL